jgi:hypothetical protein
MNGLPSSWKLVQGSSSSSQWGLALHLLPARQCTHGIIALRGKMRWRWSCIRAHRSSLGVAAASKQTPVWGHTCVSAVCCCCPCALSKHVQRP